MTDIEIAQASKMLPIEEVAAKVGIKPEQLENHQPHPRWRGQDHHFRGSGRRSEQDGKEDHRLPA